MSPEDDEVSHFMHLSIINLITLRFTAWTPSSTKVLLCPTGFDRMGSDKSCASVDVGNVKSVCKPIYNIK